MVLIQSYTFSHNYLHNSVRICIKPVNKLRFRKLELMNIAKER